MSQPGSGDALNQRDDLLSIHDHVLPGGKAHPSDQGQELASAYQVALDSGKLLQDDPDVLSPQGYFQAQKPLHCSAVALVVAQGRDVAHPVGIGYPLEPTSVLHDLLDALVDIAQIEEGLLDPLSFNQYIEQERTGNHGMLRPKMHDHLRIGFDMGLLSLPECGIFGPLGHHCPRLDLGRSGREAVFGIALGGGDLHRPLSSGQVGIALEILSPGPDPNQWIGQEKWIQLWVPFEVDAKHLPSLSLIPVGIPVHIDKGRDRWIVAWRFNLQHGHYIMNSIAGHDLDDLHLISGDPVDPC